MRQPTKYNHEPMTLANFLEFWPIRDGSVLEFTVPLGCEDAAFVFTREQAVQFALDILDWAKKYPNAPTPPGNCL